MLNILKWTGISLVAAYFVNRGCEWVQSDFLQKFLDDKLIEILVTLLAINTATMGIILLRLGELSDSRKVKFPGIVSAMKISLLEQIALVIVAAICCILQNSEVLKCKMPSSKFVFSTVLIATAIYAIVALYDTAMAAFDLNEQADKNPPPTPPDKKD